MWFAPRIENKLCFFVSFLLKKLIRFPLGKNNQVCFHILPDYSSNTIHLQLKNMQQHHAKHALNLSTCSLLCA